MAEEPSLPRLPAPAVSWSQVSQQITNGRKRVRLHGNAGPPSPMVSTSSDPAFFSSDDDPSLENYNGARRKRRLVGSWYEQQPASSDPAFGEDVLVVNPRPIRKLARHFDSGVWMAEGSDEIQGDEDSNVPTASHFPPAAKLPQLLRRQMPRISEGERIARERIKTCVEEGADAIDLSGLGLESISNETVAPLSTLAHIPIVEQDVPFEAQEQELKVFLANNWLKSLPGALFDLQNLTTLSLRQTGLRELPDAIGKLKNLKDLNLMSNRLKYLPSSLLGLLGTDRALTQLRCGNCRFFFLEDPRCETPGAIHDKGDDSVIPYAELLAWRAVSASAGAIFIARTPVQFCDTMGRRQSEFSLDELLQGDRALLTDDGTLACAFPRQTSRPGTLPGRTKVPSLVELALRKSYHSSLLPEFPGFLPEETFPTLRALLQQALAQRDEGGKRCSICGNLFVFPRTKWMEWWRLAGGTHISPGMEDNCYNDMLPFIHFGCSTACVPQDIKRGTTLEQLRSGGVDSAETRTRASGS